MHSVCSISGSAEDDAEQCVLLQHQQHGDSPPPSHSTQSGLALPRHRLLPGNRRGECVTTDSFSTAHRAISRSSHCSTTGVTKAVRGMCYPVCGMVHIKEPLLLIGKSRLCGGSGFPFSLSEWSLTRCLMPYNRR